ncbi:uncharacterized protein VP01_94g6 [Puccinia sorghi]|uniref:DUF8040 domain-containing protein n=1 Tax=Puccinia sorghi TaxID=27349 RepID=A0A0L6U6G0_9BASI|nr:uncharacterized protein VP01_94g6 [Puccinia sorghi]
MNIYLDHFNHGLMPHNASRLNPDTFQLLAKKLSHLDNDPVLRVAMEEQLVMFMYIVGQGASNTRQAQDQFQHSGDICIYLTIYPSIKQPRKVEKKEKNQESSFRITKRQNIHSLFLGCSVQRAVKKCFLLELKKYTHQSRSFLQ